MTASLTPQRRLAIALRLGEALFPFLQREGLSLQDFDGFLLHPGGCKVLETAEESLGLTRDQIRYSWQVLKEFGNMSSATALFVLKAALADGACGRYLLAGFGPGFSAYFIVLDLSKNPQDGQTAETGVFSSRALSNYVRALARTALYELGRHESRALSVGAPSPDA
jgi:3-hydroxy-3-methylglutaryl CoA synthase